MVLPPHRRVHLSIVSRGRQTNRCFSRPLINLTERHPVRSFVLVPCLLATCPVAVAAPPAKPRAAVPVAGARTVVAAIVVAGARNATRPRPRRGDELTEYYVRTA